MGKEARVKEKAMTHLARSTGSGGEGQPKKVDKSSTPISDNSQDFPIVGIGASAGGLEAFTALLENVPAETGMAFIFIQHLASGDSMLTDILQRSTSMPVHTVKNDMAVRANNVYVIPPDMSMRISTGTLFLGA